MVISGQYRHQIDFNCNPTLPLIKSISVRMQYAIRLTAGMSCLAKFQSITFFSYSITLIIPSAIDPPSHDHQLDKNDINIHFKFKFFIKRKPPYLIISENG